MFDFLIFLIVFGSGIFIGFFFVGPLFDSYYEFQDNDLINDENKEEL